MVADSSRSLAMIISRTSETDLARDLRLRRIGAGDDEELEDNEIREVFLDRWSQSDTERGTVGLGSDPGRTSLIISVRLSMTFSSVPPPITYLVVFSGKISRASTKGRIHTLTLLGTGISGSADPNDFIYMVFVQSFQNYDRFPLKKVNQEHCILYVILTSRSNG